MAFHSPSVGPHWSCSAEQSQCHPTTFKLNSPGSQSGLFSHAKNVTINGGQFNSIGGSVSILQDSELCATELASIPGLLVENLLLKKQLYKGRGYRLHSGSTDGRAVVVKVFAGPRAKELCLNAMKLHRKLLHPSFLRMIAGPISGSDPHFIVFDGDYEKTLESRLSLALKKDTKETVILGLQTVIDGSLGLDYLQDLGYPLLTARSELVLIANNKGDIVVDFNPDVEWDPEADANSGQNPANDHEPGRVLELFDELIQKTFYAPCRSHYSGQRAYFGDAKIEADEEILSPWQCGDEEVENGPDLADSALHPHKKWKSSTTLGHRRELVWKSQTAQVDSLEQISQRTQDYLDKFHLTSILNYRRGRPIASIVHQCPGYHRTEIMLTSDIERSAIVAYTEPVPGEICPVCKKVVENVKNPGVPTPPSNIQPVLLDLHGPQVAELDQRSSPPIQLPLNPTEAGVIEKKRTQNTEAARRSSKRRLKQIQQFDDFQQINNATSSSQVLDLLHVGTGYQTVLARPQKDAKELATMLEAAGFSVSYSMPGLAQNPPMSKIARKTKQPSTPLSPLFPTSIIGSRRTKLSVEDFRMYNTLGDFSEEDEGIHL